MADSAVRGRFVWHELMTTDLASALRFYRKVVGWDSKLFEKSTVPSYTMLMMGDRQRGGAMPRPEEAKSSPSVWFTYIGTPDVDATARQVQQLGGKVHRQPADIPTVGRFAMVADPQGAVFAIFTPLTPAVPPDTDRRPEVGDFSWQELLTTDWQAAWDFYQKVFGWQKTSSMQMGPEMGPNATYQMFGWDKNSQGGMFNKPAAAPGPPMWLPYIMVRDAKAAVALITEGGGKVINGPMEVPGGDWIVQGIDPQGAMFALHSRKQQAAAPKPAAKAKPSVTAKASSKAKAGKKATAKGKPARKSKAMKKTKTARKAASARRPRPAARGRKRARRR